VRHNKGSKLQQKLISIVVPVFNTEKYVERCLSSLVNQTYSNLEIIVVNDCSPGNIEEMLQPWLRKDERIRYVRHEVNKGLFQARLTGADLAQGVYIAFADSDDYVSSNFYYGLLRSAEKHQSDIAIGQTVIQKQNGDKIRYTLHDASFNFDQLSGREVQERYFGQKGHCYSWHTIWNKLYKKELWDRCRPYYGQITGHLIMTEDLAFSAPLFYFAKKVSTAKDDCYFYCENTSAATNVEKISLERFSKNIHDLKQSFDFCENFLTQVGSPESYRDDFRQFRDKYARIWGSLGELVFTGIGQHKVRKLMEEFAPGCDIHRDPDDFFFESLQSPWNESLEKIKLQIRDDQCEVVSFDIFDTAVYRPLYHPTDLFYLMDKKFEALAPSKISFHEIRTVGEEEARRKYGEKHPSFQDVKIEEIYQSIGEYFGLAEDVTLAMLAEEKRLEIALCRPRKTAKELYDFALLCGKKVIFTSDMYLDEETIRAVLSQCGYTEYEQLYLSSSYRLTKHQGDLYRAVLKDIKVKAANILHIGDNLQNDVTNARKYGIDAVHFPRALDVFENKIAEAPTGGCSTVAQLAGGAVVDPQALTDSLGYRTMIALIANRYFDNPFRGFDPQTDFNADPYFIGYYPLGMHLFGLTNWLQHSLSGRSYQTVHFLARDGYLPMKAYEIFENFGTPLPAAQYACASRKALMPAIVSDRMDFFDLPVEYRNHSPKTLLKVLKFCARDVNETEIEAQLSAADIPYQKVFERMEEYRRFLKYFLANLYSSEKHRQAYEEAKPYYAGWKTNADAAFDMGYSGRIQEAICRLAGQPIHVFFVHRDEVRAPMLERKSGFHAECFYDFTPTMSGLIREHLFSEAGGSCIAFRQENGQAVPVIEEEEKKYPDRFIVEQIQRGALDFCRDFLEIFGGYLSWLPFKNLELSLPFEGYLSNMKDADCRLFKASYFEDTVYGAKASINIYDFLRAQYARVVRPDLSGPEMVNRLLYKRGKLTKLLGYILFDRVTLKEKVKKRLANHNFLLRVTTRAYQVWKKLKRGRS